MAYRGLVGRKEAAKLQVSFTPSQFLKSANQCKLASRYIVNLGNLNAKLQRSVYCSLYLDQFFKIVCAF
jgi:hypothetical protein